MHLLLAALQRLHEQVLRLHLQGAPRCRLGVLFVHHLSTQPTSQSFDLIIREMEGRNIQLEGSVVDLKLLAVSCPSVDESSPIVLVHFGPSLEKKLDLFLGRIHQRRVLYLISHWMSRMVDLELGLSTC